MAEICEEALARRPGEDAGRQVLGDGERLEQRRHARVAQQRRPAVQLPVQVLPLVVAGGGGVLGGPADEGGEGGGGGAVAARSAARARRGAGATGWRGRSRTRFRRRRPRPGSPAAWSASRTVSACRFVRTSTARSPGAHRLPSRLGAVGAARDERRLRPEQPDDVAGEVGGDGRPRGRSRVRVRVWVRSTLVAPWTTRTRSGAACGASSEAALDVGRGRADRAVGDALVAEQRPGEQGVEGVDESLVAPPVRGRAWPPTAPVRRLPGRRRRRRRGRRRWPASGRRSGRASSRPAPNARRMISHWTGSVSWNSSTRATS